jgi:hypothetical protein
MAWTTPKTWAFQEGVESAELNLHLRDNLNAIGGPIARARKTADQSVTASSTLVDCTDLGFAIAASEVWVIQLHLAVTCSAAGDWKHAWTVPAGCTGEQWDQSFFSGTGSDGHGVSSITASNVTAVSADAAGVFAIGAAVTNSTTAGTVQFQFAQNSPSGTATVQANSFLIAHRIG